MNTKQETYHDFNGSSTEMTRGSKSDKELYDGPPTKHRFSFDDVKGILRPGCPTCKGKGGTYDDEAGTEDHCEDCKGTGERRRGEERRKGYDSGGITLGLSSTGRRSGKMRRK